MRRIASMLAVMAGTGCSSGNHAFAGDAAAAVRVPVTIVAETGEVVFQAELADTDAERSLGLMYRTSLGEREGMLFLFPDEAPRTFWMRNTVIALDMIFIRTDRTILGIVESATPRTDTPRSVPGKSQFVLEIKGGLARELGIRVGQTVGFYAPLP